MKSLNQFRLEQGWTWHYLCGMLNAQCIDPLYQGRLNRLRSGKPATQNERRAILELTGGEVDSYMDEQSL